MPAIVVGVLAWPGVTGHGWSASWQDPELTILRVLVAGAVGAAGLMRTIRGRRPRGQRTAGR